MKITAVETKIVNAIHRNWIFVKVMTDQPGLIGWGEATLEWKTRAVVGAVEDLVPFIIGEDPRRIEHLVRKMQLHSFWPLGVIGLSAISGIEQALHDLSAKDLGVPVSRMLGGRSRDSVRVYTHFRRAKIGAQVDPEDIEAYVAGVEETVAMGYSAIKLGVVPYTGYDAPLSKVKHVAKLAEKSVARSETAWRSCSTSTAGVPRSARRSITSTRSRPYGRCLSRSRSNRGTMRRWRR